MIAIQAFLIGCTYEYYCQGWEKTQGTFLVYGESFADACKLLVHNCPLEGANFREFQNLTVGSRM